jgi:hypothetical protein
MIREPAHHDPKTMYGDKVERIYRVLLSKKTPNPTWYRVAKEAGTSYGWAYKNLAELEEAGLIERYRVIDPKGMFSRWADRNDLRVFREYHIQNPDDVLEQTSLYFAYTGYYAENLVGHYLFPRYREIYIRQEDAAAWHSHLSANGYVGRGNVQIILADPHVFFEQSMAENKPVVSIQQLIVDLYRNGAECAEAADLLVEREYKEV